jgi:ABC-2 type transport system permease protein
MHRLRAIIRKEFLHIFRDRRSLLILFVMPVLMMILFGYAVKLDISNIMLFTADADDSSLSRELVRRFYASGYFSNAGMSRERADADELFRRHAAGAVLAIPKDFEKSLRSGSPLPVQFLTDATDSNTATIASQYAEQIVMLFVLSNVTLPAGGMPEVRSLILFNPQLQSSDFIVPGLVAILFMMVCALLTSVTIAREKETGTMEQILVSPVRVREIIIGKVLPYAVLAAAIGIVVLVFSKFWFGVPFRGQPLYLAGISFVYVLCSLSIGIFISTKVSTMQVALMLALIITMLPSVMLSGFMFPISSMPKIIQIATHVVPARYFLIIIRSIMLKGVGIYPLRDQILALGIFTLLLLVVSVKRFKATLE